MIIFLQYVSMLGYIKADEVLNIVKLDVYATICKQKFG